MNNIYAVNTTMEPLYWLKNNFLQRIEKVLVAGLIILTIFGVFFTYWIGLPYWWEKSPCFTIFLVIIGNWILMNIIFHYFMGLTTPPGYPPRNKRILNAVAICKKCIAPKPPRTHHCSVCDACILQMDHHCPWLNNCVGVFNARYFFLYIVYMLLGILFIFFGGIEIIYVVICLQILDEIFHPYSDNTYSTNESDFAVPVPLERADMPKNNVIAPLTELQRIAADPLKSKVILYFSAILIDGLVGLIVLIYIHGRNISRGETYIESHSNLVNRNKYGSAFVNPYDLGFWKNWQLFLGLDDGRTFVRHILFPSAHKPYTDGISFQTVHNDRDSSLSIV